MSTINITKHSEEVFCWGTNHKHRPAVTGTCPRCNALVVKTHTGKIVDRSQRRANGTIHCWADAHDCDRRFNEAVQQAYALYSLELRTENTIFEAVSHVPEAQAKHQEFCERLLARLDADIAEATLLSQYK